MGIHIRSLQDRYQFYDPSNLATTYCVTPARWSLFGVVWDPSPVLANIMLDYKHILEIGCGIRLANMLLNANDFLYDASHIDELAHFRSRHSNSPCEVIIVDPGKFPHSRFSRIMKELGFNGHQTKPEHAPHLNVPFLGRIPHYNRDQT